MKTGTRQPRKQIVMKSKDRLTVQETEYVIGLLNLHDKFSSGVLEKLARCLSAAQQASEKAYLIRNTETRRPKRFELRISHPSKGDKAP